MSGLKRQRDFYWTRSRSQNLKGEKAESLYVIDFLG